MLQLSKQMQAKEELIQIEQLQDSTQSQDSALFRFY